MSMLNLDYMGSPHHRPKFTYPSPADASNIQPNRPIRAASQTPQPPSSTAARRQKQRRISRSQHGLHVSRRLPARTSRGSLPAADDDRSPRSEGPQSPENPYWGTLQSPSASCRNSRETRIAGNRTFDISSNEPTNIGPSEDKVLPKTDAFRCDPGPRAPKGQGRKTPNRVKRFGIADPLSWDVIDRSLTQQHRLSSLVGKDDPVVVPVNSSSKSPTDVVSRTSSQKRALNRFAKELEKYANAVGAAGKVPVVTPTISDSKPSVHTVKPLMPYKDEFLAAGLAVTSIEQNSNSRIRAQPSLQMNRPRKPSNGLSQAERGMMAPGHGVSPSISPATSCASSGSYVEFSPSSEHMLHAIESLVPRKPDTKSKHCHYGRKRLLSWFLKKPPCKDGNVKGHHVPVRIQQVKGGKIKPNDLSSARYPHLRVQHRNHKLATQGVPEMQSGRKPALPTKFVTPKKEPYVALTSNYCEQSDRGPHPEKEGEHYGSVIDARQSLGQVGLLGKKDIAGGFLSKPHTEPIETIEEETEMHTNQVEQNAQSHHSLSTSQKRRPSATEDTRRRPDAVSSATQGSSVPTLPFAAKIAASTASSLQRALDDACRKLDDEDKRTGNLLEKANLERGLPPIPQRDSRHSAVLPRKPRPADKFIYVKRNMPTVEAPRSIFKPLPPEPVMATQASSEERSKTRPTQPPHQPQSASQELTGGRKNAVAELAKAEEMLKDLDVYLNDYDDADIQDRDVIKGLQVAIHAAADDLYDGYIRYKTGLRIRRFLADLKSFEDISELSSADQQGREKHTKSTKLRGVRDRSSRC